MRTEDKKPLLSFFTEEKKLRKICEYREETKNKRREDSEKREKKKKK